MTLEESFPDPLWSSLQQRKQLLVAGEIYSGDCYFCNFRVVQLCRGTCTCTGQGPHLFLIKHVGGEKMRKWQLCSMDWEASPSSCLLPVSLPSLSVSS